MKELCSYLPIKVSVKQKKPAIKAIGYFIVALVAGLLPLKLSAQAPTVSYSGPQTFYAGSTITTLTPTSSNVAAPAYSLARPKLIDSGFFDSSYGLAIDAGGNLFLPGYTENQIFEVTANNHASHNVVASITKPYGMAVDAAGNIYTCQRDQGLVYRISGGSQFLIASGLNLPLAVAADSKGNVYVADYGVNTLWKIPITGGPLVNLGTFSGISYVMVDANDNVYFNNSSYIEEIPAGSSTPISVPTSIGFVGINAIAIDGAGNMFVTNNNSTVDEVLGGTDGHTVAITSGFGGIGGIAVDGYGHVFASDGYTQSVKILNPLGGYFITPLLPAGLSFDGATGSITGTPTVASPSKNYTITAYNSHGVSTTAHVNITVLPNPAGLSQIQLSAGTLSPAFSTITTNYTVNVANSSTSIIVKPFVAHAGATVTVNGAAVASGTNSAAIPLSVGQNTISIAVMASGGAQTTTYTLTVTRAASANAQLSNLKLGGGAALSPAFTATNTNYTATVSNSTGSIILTPTSADANASIQVSGYQVTSKTASPPIYLSPGDNFIDVVVTAQDGVTTNTYEVDVTRTPSSDANLSRLTVSNGTLSPAFAGGTTSYTVNVPNNISTIYFTPTAENSTATITAGDEQVPSGSPTEPTFLNAGSNMINIMVAASDGTTTRTYTVNVIRAPLTNAYLYNLKVNTATISPAFAYTTFNYTANVSNATQSVTITPVVSSYTATVTVNGAAVNSASASGAVTLNVGSNTITTIVTAQDGATTQTYTVVITRAPAMSMNIPDEEVAVAATKGGSLTTDGIVVHEALSPNGDGKNDYFNIENITNYPDNKLTITNRSGQLVYEAKGYDNASKIFDGHSNKTGQMQLPGTYFYSLDYTVKGITKHKTGFIVLKY